VNLTRYLLYWKKTMKKLLITSVSAIAISGSCYAESNFFDYTLDATQDAHLCTETKTENSRLPARTIVDFTNFSYSTNKKAWKEKDKELYNRFINDGWKLDPFNGTTGSASDQIESVSGLLAFKDYQVVIATRGTEMTNWDDWKTNFRFSRSPFVKFFADEDESNKIEAINAQLFNGLDGEIANGFLQTHFSSWEYIRKSIQEYAKSIGKSPKDLTYTITGHSKGAAKAQLNALNLLTDSALGIGVDYLEKSFIFNDPDISSSIMGSGFLGVAKKTEPKNKGNVEAIVFESPRVFDVKAAGKVDAIIGKGNLGRVENISRMSPDWDDPVTKVSPEFFGFQHAGTPIRINAGGTFVTRHMMGNVGEAAITAIEEHRKGQIVEVTTDFEKMVSGLVYVGNKSVDYTKSIVNFGISSVKRIKQHLFCKFENTPQKILA
jgi:Lipase (class 3)